MKICKDLEIASPATVTAFLGLLLLATAAEAETLLEVFGGEGGNPVRVDCEPGSYVVGLKGRAGAWMDQISIVCGRWDEKAQRLQSVAQGKVKGPFGDSTGGDALSESCPDGWAVSAYDIRTTLEEWNSSVNVKNYRAKFVHGIRFYCRPAIAGSGQVVHKTLGSWSTGDVSRFWGTWSCPPRELATGMHGRAGLFVDALGLICELRPEPAAVGVETKPSGGPIVAPGPIEGTGLKKGPIVAAPDPAAIQSFCEGYANHSLQQALENQRLSCGFSGPRWDTNRDVHFNWCMSLNGDQKLPDAEIAARIQKQKDCMAAKQPTTDLKKGPIIAKPGENVPAPDPLHHGSATCKDGFVWRVAGPSDLVCVTSEARNRVAYENQTATDRWRKNSKKCGKDYVKRDAFPGDEVCVTKKGRRLAQEENKLGPSRRVQP